MHGECVWNKPVKKSAEVSSYNRLGFHYAQENSSIVELKLKWNWIISQLFHLQKHSHESPDSFTDENADPFIKT